MKVFLAWSGPASEGLAKFMHGWLPSVVQAIQPFMSSQDIRQGQRWASEISAKLAEANFAILCLTPTNLCSPWIHFEAGAIARNVENGRVSALLFRVAPTQIGLPLQQFQHTPLARDDIWKLLQDLNRLCATPLSEALLRKSFERGYPELEAELNALNATLEREVEGCSYPTRSTEAILEDLLSTQQGLASKLNAVHLRLQSSEPLRLPREASDDDDIVRVLQLLFIQHHGNPTLHDLLSLYLPDSRRKNAASGFHGKSLSVADKADTATEPPRA